MKGVVLAGGLGKRLGPLTRITNKHLLPIYDRPMIYYPIQSLVEAGIKDILIVTGGNDAGDFLRLLGNGSEFGLKHLDYTYQRGEGGIAEALSLAEHFAGGGPLVVMLGDNIVDMYDATVFDVVRTLKPSSRGELEITDVNNAYLRRGQLTYDLLQGWWTDAGLPETLYRAATLVRERALEGRAEALAVGSSREQ